MKKIILLFSVLGILYSGYSQNTNYLFSELIEEYKQMTPDTLLKIGDMFSKYNANDSALICYSLIYNNPAVKNDTILIDALNKAGVIYYHNAAYKTALDMYLKALKISEETGYTTRIALIYNNIGKIYIRFKDYKNASKNFQIALPNMPDRAKPITLTNLGSAMYYENNFDSAMFFVREAYNLGIKIDDYPFINMISNNIGCVFMEQKQYDSAKFYMQLALNGVKANNSPKDEATILHSIGDLYKRMKIYDSSTYYLKKSIVLSEETASIENLSFAYLTYYQLEKEFQNNATALKYHEKYAAIQDSIFNIQTFSEIKKQEFLYNMTKADKQIKLLNDEQELSKQQIKRQKQRQIILTITLIVFSAFFLLLYISKRKLNKAYKKIIELVEEKMNIVYKDKQVFDISDKAEENKKYKSSSLSDELQKELKTQILNVMNTPEVIFAKDFSITKLAEIVNSNQKYVSQVINDTFHKNFSTFHNEYRIKQAILMLQNNEHKKYTMEAIGKMVGFESRRSFNAAFKEITGLTPSFYVKSISNTET